MRKSEIKTLAAALAYVTDCTLATVQSMAILKSRKKTEFKRQIAIAQTAFDWMRDMGVDYSDTRAADVADAGGSVEEWVQQYIV